MPFDRADFERAKSERRYVEIRRHETMLRRFAMAEVPMAQLTADARWNQFLQVAQARLEDERREMAAAIEQLASPSLADPTLISLTKLRIAELRGRIASREEMIGLPSEILESAKEAANLLREIA